MQKNYWKHVFPRRKVKYHISVRIIIWYSSRNSPNNYTCDQNITRIGLAIWMVPILSTNCSCNDIHRKMKTPQRMYHEWIFIVSSRLRTGLHAAGLIIGGIIDLPAAVCGPWLAHAYSKENLATFWPVQCPGRVHAGESRLWPRGLR